MTHNNLWEGITCLFHQATKAFEDRNDKGIRRKAQQLQALQQALYTRCLQNQTVDVNDEKVSAEAERDDELKRIRTEALTMAQDKEVQNMLIQEKYDRMDWLTYGKEQKNEGDRQRMEEDAKGMYAEGIKPDVIARVQKVFVDVIEKILGLQPV